MNKVLIMITYYMSVINRFFLLRTHHTDHIEYHYHEKSFCEKLVVYWLGRVLIKFYIPFHIFHAILHGYDSYS